MKKKRTDVTLWLVLAVLFSLCLSCCGHTQIPRANLTFPKNKSTVEIPFTRYRNWIILKVSVNDSKELSFILDTGAPIAVLSYADTNNQLHLNIAGNAMVDGGNGNNSKSVPLATAVRFKIGDMNIENGLMAVDPASEAISGVDGVIGKYLFDDAIVTIDWNKNRLILTKPEDYKYNGGGEVIPIKLLPSGHICANIDIEKNGKKVSATSDTDLGNRSNFSVDKEEETSVITKEKTIKDIIVLWSANGPATGDIARTNVTIGSLTLNDVPTAFTKFSNIIKSDGINANIGLSILERFTPTFNYTDKKLILEKNEKFDAPFIFNRSGIILNPKRETDYVIIAGIIPASPAQASGLQKDDRIISINGEKIAVLSQDAIDSLIQGKTSQTIEIEILRNGTHIQSKIKMTTLI